MSISNSYFNRNNTIIYNNLTNTGRNPVTELFYGEDGLVNPRGFSRFIFDIDLSLLTQKINDGTISTGCTSAMTHTLNMTNTSYFDKDFLNTSTSQGRYRATSFDLFLFRIPLNSVSGTSQNWDEGVGYDYIPTTTVIFEDKNYSDRPSNWSATTTIDTWEEPGIYNNTNTGIFNYNQLQIINTQHFEFGDENIEFDMTNEINAILNGFIPDPVGWGVAYLPQVENISGTTGTYSVGFFTRHTQTFYEPYLQTNYNDLIEDDRNLFALGKVNKLYLYVYEDGDFQNLDFDPVVEIRDTTCTAIPGLTGLTTCRRSKGVYEVVIPPLIGYKTPCTFTDVWSNLFLNGFPLSNITNEFTIYPLQKSLQMGTLSQEPSMYGFDFYGIKQDEKILNTDVRKVGVVIKKAYTPNHLLLKVDASYRVYVKEGSTEVQVQDWTKINRTPNEYYFIFDTRDKIPNEYFIDIKVLSSGEVNTYKRQIKFQIVNKK